MNHSCADIVASFGGNALAREVSSCHGGEVYLWSQPYDAEIHCITAGMIHRFTTCPLALSKQPTGEIIASEQRSMQFLKCGCTQERARGLPLVHMNVHELSPISYA